MSVSLHMYPVLDRVVINYVIWIDSITEKTSRRKTLYKALIPPNRLRLLRCRVDVRLFLLIV